MIKFPCKKCVLYAICIAKPQIRCEKLYKYVDEVNILPTLLIKKYNFERYLPNVVRVIDDNINETNVGPNYRSAYTVNQPYRRKKGEKFSFLQWVQWTLKS